MAYFVRGVPLVATVAAAQDIVGEQFLTSIEAASQLELDNLLLASSDAIYDQLNRELDGKASVVTNAEVYYPAVAFHFLARLVMRGWLPLPPGRQAPADAFEWSDPYVKRVRPELPDAGSQTPLGAPFVLNAERSPLFGRGVDRPTVYTTRVRTSS